MYDKVLVPLDGSKMAECVFDHVLEICRNSNTKEVILFRVCEPLNLLSDYPRGLPDTWETHVKEMNEFSNSQCSIYLEDVARRFQEKGLVNVKMSSRLGNPATEIADYASRNDVDLIIMASHGRTGASRWAYGSVADKVFRSTCVPILIVRAPGCVVGF